MSRAITTQTVPLIRPVATPIPSTSSTPSRPRTSASIFRESEARSSRATESAPACVSTQSALSILPYQPSTSSTLSRIACPRPMPLLTATTSTPAVSAVRIGCRTICSTASVRSIRHPAGTKRPRNRTSGIIRNGVTLTNASSSAIPETTEARGGQMPTIISPSDTAATPISTAAATRRLRSDDFGGAAGAAERPSRRSSAVACRAGHHAAATATTTPSVTATGTSSGCTASPAAGVCSAREMPAEIGPAAARPTTAPAAAPTPPRIAASTVTSRRTCRPVAPSSRISDRPRRRSATFISIALPTMNQAMARVSAVTKSSPRLAEWRTSSAMLARPTGMSAESDSGSRLLTSASARARSASAVRATRTRSTSAVASDIDSST